MAEARIVHLLPTGIGRGAQAYAMELVRVLNGRGAHHEIVTLFATPDGATVDVAFDIENGWRRRVGLDPVAVHRLRTFVRSTAPNVVVAHGGEPLKYAAFAGVPPSQLVYYKVGAHNARLTGARRALHGRLLRRAGTVAAVSEGAANEVRSLGIAADNVHVIPNGRDPQRCTPRHDRPDAGKVRFVFVGHLDPPKRPERFVDVVRALQREGLPVEGVVAGEGPLLDELRRNAPSNVELRGFVDDVPALLADSDVFMLTSMPMEGMPGVLIEAGLAALPSISTDVPGAADVIESATTGFVVPVDDFDALVTAARTLVTDPARRASMGDAARRRCLQRFTLEASAQQWEALLDEVLARR